MDGHVNSVGKYYCDAGIVDIPFHIMTCRFLLAIAFRTWGLVCIKFSFASREFVWVCSAHSDLDFTLHSKFCQSAWTPCVHWVELLYC